MSNDINLVSGKSLDVDKQFKNLKILRYVALTSLLIVAIVSGVFFILTLFLPLNSVKKEQEQTLLGISALHKKLVNSAFISDRITNINGLIKKRKNYPYILEGVFKKIPDDLYIEEIEIFNKRFKLNITGKSLLSLNQYIDYLIKYSSNSVKIKNLEVEGLVYEPNLKQFTITFKTEVIE